MTAFVALLRAVNLGPHNKIAMADLRTVATSAGLTEPSTLLQSGNLVFKSLAKSTASLEKLLEAALKHQLGLATPVVVRSLDEWRAALAANPFPHEADKDPSHVLLMPLKREPSAASVTALSRAIVDRESVKSHARELYLVYPDGIGESKLTSSLIEKTLGVSGTARNWNTAQKLLRQLEE